MGCVLGVCAAQAACCCASSACSLCCACCPSSVTSVMTRLMYLFVLIVGILLSSIFLIPSIEESLSKKPNIPFWDKSYCEITGLSAEKCKDIIGYASVYRVWFSFTMFFLLMAILTIGVKSSKDCRAQFQNGLWFFKFLIIGGIMVGAFFIPQKPFNEIWMYIGLVGAVLFIFIQVVFLIYVAHSWTESWQDGAEDNKCYAVGFVISCLIMYGLSIAGVVSMYVLFTKASGCGTNTALITINLILCVAVSIIAVLPRVQEENPRSGLLQASLVTLYVIYLTFSAVSNNPDCGDNINSIAGGGNSMLVVGIIIAVLTIFVVSLKSSSDGMGTPVTDEEAPVQKVSDDEEDGVQYKYWLFHIMCLLATLYLMMVMTNWLKPDTVSEGYKFEASKPSMWVQIVSSWLCLGLYVWTLFAPIACPNRQFSWAGSGDS